MPLVAYVQAQIVDPTTGATILDVFNRETIQLPGPSLQPAHGDLMAGVIERLGEDVKDRAMDQAKEFARTP